MDAQEFVKDCGIEVAKRTLDNAIGFGCSGIELFGGKYVFRTDDLKTLVDAWELVESRGGLSEAKAIEQQYWNSGVGSAMFVAMEIKQAIKLVESCQ